MVHDMKDTCELCQHWKPVFQEIVREGRTAEWFWTVVPWMNLLVNLYGPPETCGWGVWCGQIASRMAERVGLFAN